VDVAGDFGPNGGTAPIGLVLKVATIDSDVLHHDKQPAGIARSGLAHWYDLTFGSAEIVDSSLDEMIAQPRFAQACLHCVRGVLAERAANPALARAVMDSARTLSGLLVLVMDASGGVTLSALQALCAELGIASPGRAAAMMTHLRRIGYIKPDPDPTDRRTRRFIASANMLNAFQTFIRNELSAIALIEPAAQQVADRLTEPEIYKPYCRQMGVGLFRLVSTPRTASTVFSERNGGIVILYNLAISGEEGDVYPPRGPVRVSVASLARKSGVSRSHVLRLLRDAENLGLLRRSADDGICFLEEPLRIALSRLHATSFIGHASFAHCALQAAR
jgi:DNA-binding MarR family transcriptional regulator